MNVLPIVDFNAKQVIYQYEKIRELEKQLNMNKEKLKKVKLLAQLSDDDENSDSDNHEIGNICK